MIKTYPNGIPKCWGQFIDDDECQDCAFYDSCEIEWIEVIGEGKYALYDDPLEEDDNDQER